MPKMTDYVRKGFQRRPRPWDQAEMPEWWGLATWAGAAAIVLMILVAAAFNRGGDSAGANAAASPTAPRPVESINPYSPNPVAPGNSPSTPPSTAPSTGPSTAPSGPASGEGGSAGAPSNDYAATAAVPIKKTGGGDTVVPAGAKNVAAAGARAEAIGDWTGVPYTAPGTPPQRTKTPQGAVDGELTVADPAVTGNSVYTFTATIKTDPAASPATIQITVHRGPAGYSAALRKGPGGRG